MTAMTKQLLAAAPFTAQAAHTHAPDAAHAAPPPAAAARAKRPLDRRMKARNREANFYFYVSYPFFLVGVVLKRCFTTTGARSGGTPQSTRSLHEETRTTAQSCLAFVFTK